MLAVLTLFLSDDGISLRLFMYLAVSVLSCGMGNLLIHRTDSLVVVYGLNSCRMWA